MKTKIPNEPASSRFILILFGILDIMCRAVFPLSNVMFDAASDTSTAIAYTCIAITYATVLQHHDQADTTAIGHPVDVRR